MSSDVPVKPLKSTRLARFLGRAQWLGILALGLWFIRRPPPDALVTPPALRSPRRSEVYSRLDELSRLPPEARARAGTIAPAMRSELSLSLEKIRRADRAVRDATAMKHSDPAGAGALFRRALTDNPYQPDALAELGAEALARGDFDEARSFAARGLAVNPTHAGCAELARAVGIAAERNSHPRR